MGYWATATGKENAKEIKTTMTIVFSEFETSHGPICKTCYSANAVQVQAK